MFKLIGVLIIFICVLGGYAMEGGPFAALYQPAEFVIIGGAALGFLVISNSRAVLMGVLSYITGLIRGTTFTPHFYQELLQLMFQLFESARKQGLKGLEEDIESPSQSALFQSYPRILRQERIIHLLCDTLRLMLIQQLPSHELESMLEEEIQGVERDLGRSTGALLKVADALPGFGILAAVMGIIVTMGHIDGNLAVIGMHVAAALTGTFLGIFMSYGLASPMAHAVEEEINREIMALDMLKSALVAFNSGKPPMLAVDAGRRVLYSEIKPSFIDMESELSGQ
ncbi:flagellar motor stator protein MotA [Dongshaea marina]|uniref:flagellar motor stator protein MotA n=1 Tax=Dongshaea marina TaxID=2047966 RepID=UPI000D3E84B8|nr:flagellar motor stator protein MotA [Dongshaea marina]